MLPLLLLLVLALALPASAGAASRFVGVNFDGLAVEQDAVARELRRAADAGAGSVRVAVYWPQLQPYATWDAVPAEQRSSFRDVRGVPTDFRATDGMVRAAAEARLHLTVVVMAAAPWAAENPYATFSPPTDPARYGEFARTLAERYGGRGTFWSEHREARKRAVRTWQIWNEPAGFDGFGSPTNGWNSRRDALSGYLAMLRSARTGLKDADPRAHVMLSGFFGKAWISLRQVYRAGARGLFDSVGVHPYTRRPAGVVEVVRRARRVMSRFGDRGKPIAVTEVTWTSSAGRMASSLPFTTTERGQARRLTRVYRLLGRAAPRLRISSAYWYTWLTRDVGDRSAFDYAGLLTDYFGRVLPKPAFNAFKRVARRLRGVG